MRGSLAGAALVIALAAFAPNHRAIARGLSEDGSEQEGADQGEVFQAATAQDVRVEMRVVGVLESGRARVDRGAADGLEPGDLVRFQPRDGVAFLARVVEVELRSALVEPVEPGRSWAAGTRGSLSVPAARFRPDEAHEEPRESPEERDIETRPPSAWSREADDWSQDRPLLAGLRGVHPSERTPFMSGRLFVGADLIVTDDDSRRDRFLRAGGELRYHNLGRRGGELHAAVEWDQRATRRVEQDDLSSSRLRVERFSYREGGTRFDPAGWQAGRFLQSGMPEFGVLDGGEWSFRREEGHRFGASMGWMPLPDQEFTSGRDFQVGLWYQWVADPSEWLAARAGYQKTWNDGAADRDLFVLAAHYLPRDGWRGFATAWVDWYTSGDEERGPGLGLTQAFVNANREFDGRWGLALDYVHLEFPELDRKEFYPEVLPEQLAKERLDRVGAELWADLVEEGRVFGRLGLWKDVRQEGGDVEVGFRLDGLFGTGSASNTSVFAVDGAFTEVLGARQSLQFGGERIFSDFGYEYAHQRQKGFPSESDEFQQHRVRAGLVWRPTLRLSLSSSVEATLRDQEYGLAVGVFAQWTF